MDDLSGRLAGYLEAKQAMETQNAKLEEMLHEQTLLLQQATDQLAECEEAKAAAADLGRHTELRNRKVAQRCSELKHVQSQLAVLGNTLAEISEDIGQLP